MVAVARRWRKRAVVSGKERSTTSRERAAPGIFFRAPFLTRLSMCSATAETEERPSADMISRYDGDSPCRAVKSLIKSIISACFFVNLVFMCYNIVIIVLIGPSSRKHRVFVWVLRLL